MSRSMPAASPSPAPTVRSVSPRWRTPRSIDGNELVESGEFTPTAVTFPNGTHICEVEIDPDTGATEVVRYSAVEELGYVLNPMLVAGQTHGGVAQGVGQAMAEQIVHDPQSGQMLTASFMDYQMPRADDLPDIRMTTREVPTKVNPLGAKGVGEAGTVGAMAAAMNAVNDALAPLGIRHFDMPATPNRVWAAIAAARAMSEPLFHMVAGAPTPVAPFSHAVEADGWVFLTGQMPTLPDDDSAPLPDGHRGADPAGDGQRRGLHCRRRPPARNSTSRSHAAGALLASRSCRCRIPECPDRDVRQPRCLRWGHCGSDDQAACPRDHGRDGVLHQALFGIRREDQAELTPGIVLVDHPQGFCRRHRFRAPPVAWR